MTGLSFSGRLGSWTGFSWQSCAADPHCRLPCDGSGKCPVTSQTGLRLVLQHCRAGLNTSGAAQKNPNMAVSALKTPQTKCKMMLQAKIKVQTYFLSSRMNIWVGCCELGGCYDARPGAVVGAWGQPSNRSSPVICPWAQFKKVVSSWDSYKPYPQL